MVTLNGNFNVEELFMTNYFKNVIAKFRQNIEVIEVIKLFQ